MTIYYIIYTYTYLEFHNQLKRKTFVNNLMYKYQNLDGENLIRYLLISKFR